MKVFVIIAVLISALNAISLRRQDTAEVDVVKDTVVTGDSFYTDCSTADDKTRMELNSVTVDPNPPKKGEQVHVKVQFTLKEEVTSGEVNVKLNYGVIPIINEDLDLCDLVTQIGRQCPLQKGPFGIDLKEQLPGYIPSGKYEGNATITDQNNKGLACMEITLSI